LQAQIMNTCRGVVSALLVLLGASLPAIAEDAPPEKPLSALIVYDHGGTTTALRVEGERQLAILEAYFPGYRTQPESGEVGAWEAKYEVFINLKHGKTYRVLVSSNSRFWSMGRGDFEMRGYFTDFVAAMLKAKNPRR
jgi:hypothetical protein